MAGLEPEYDGKKLEVFSDGSDFDTEQDTEYRFRQALAQEKKEERKESEQEEEDKKCEASDDDKPWLFDGGSAGTSGLGRGRNLSGSFEMRNSSLGASSGDSKLGKGKGIACLRDMRNKMDQHAKKGQERGRTR